VIRTDQQWHYIQPPPPQVRRERSWHIQNRGHSRDGIRIGRVEETRKKHRTGLELHACAQDPSFS
jgi:hypothetical protein